MQERQERRERVVAGRLPIDVAATVSPLGRGGGDPCHQRASDGSVWHASREASGAVSFRLTQGAGGSARAQAWGPGAEEFLERLPVFFGLDEQLADFAPDHPLITEAHRRLPGLRMVRTGLVLEALVPAILEQKVHLISAKQSWRRLVRKYGEPAPGPAPPGMLLPPSAQTWRMVPSWEFHRANVDPKRAAAIVRAARLAPRLEATAALPAAEARTVLESIPGIGEWTSAETAQRSHGDSDALSVGDFHLAAMVGWTLLGEPLDDAGMVEYLEPLRPHRHRAVRLLRAAGLARKPKFGPRTPLTDHSRI
ncbi:MAG: DNA-3-methyladenine glycosylase 2 family protein [Mycobacteriaceae bacterium]|nr:DNA-3-methyladenine glycosylase 2 family protein [Mycobacteriaceae bacterium]